jgi:hypothetical protein
MPQLFVSYAVKKGFQLIDIKEDVIDYHEPRTKTDIEILALRLDRELEKAGRKNCTVSIINFKLLSG